MSDNQQPAFKDEGGKRLFGKDLRRKEIEDQINMDLGKQHDAFMSGPWKDTKFNEETTLHPLPEWFIPDFKLAILAVPPGALEIKYVAIDRISKETNDTISFGDVGLAINAINKSEPRAYVGTDFDLFREKRDELDRLTFVLNEAYKMKEKELGESKVLRMKLAGATNWTKSESGIITNE